VNQKCEIVIGNCRRIILTAESFFLCFCIARANQGSWRHTRQAFLCRVQRYCNLIPTSAKSFLTSNNLVNVVISGREQPTMAIAFFRFPSLSATKRITIIQGQSRNLNLRGVFLKKRPALLVISTKPEETPEDMQNLRKYVADIRKHKWPETRMLYGGIKEGLSIAFEKVKARRVESVKDIVELAQRLGHPSGEVVGKWIENGLAICPGIGPWAKTGGKISFQGETPRRNLLQSQNSDAVKLFPDRQQNYQIPGHVPRIRKVEPKSGIRILPGGKVQFQGIFPPPVPGETRDESMQHMNPGPKDDVFKPAAGTARLRKVESGYLIDPAEFDDKRKQGLDEIDELFRERDEARVEREQREIKEVMQMIGAEQNLNQNNTIPSHDNNTMQESEILQKISQRLGSAEEPQLPPKSAESGPTLQSTNPTLPQTHHPSLQPAHTDRRFPTKLLGPLPNQPPPTASPSATQQIPTSQRVPPPTNSPPTSYPARSQEEVAGDSSPGSMNQASASGPKKANAWAGANALAGATALAGAAGGAKPRVVRYFDERPLVRYHVVDKPLPAKGLVRKHYCGDPDDSGVLVCRDEPLLSVLVRD
jgi:hypothetical protein